MSDAVPPTTEVRVELLATTVLGEPMKSGSDLPTGPSTERAAPDFPHEGLTNISRGPRKDNFTELLPELTPPPRLHMGDTIISMGSGEQSFLRGSR